MLAHLGPLPYLVLLQVGFTMPALLPRTRCALTAPFHPCGLLQLARQQLRRFALCCTFRRLAPPRRYLAPDPPEPGLSSTPDVAARSSDHLAGSPSPTIRWCARKSIFRVGGFLAALSRRARGLPEQGPCHVSPAHTPHFALRQ